MNLILNTIFHVKTNMNVLWHCKVSRDRFRWFYLKKRQKWKEKEKTHATSHCLIQESKMRNTQRKFTFTEQSNTRSEPEISWQTLVHQSQQHCPLSTGFKLLFPVFMRFVLFSCLIFVYVHLFYHYVFGLLALLACMLPVVNKSLCMDPI